MHIHSWKTCTIRGYHPLQTQFYIPTLDTVYPISQVTSTPHLSGSKNTPQQRPCDAAELSAPLSRHSRPVAGTGGRRSTPQHVSGQRRDSARLHGEQTTGDTGREEEARRGRRRASAVEVFMSHLEGERGPRDRRESIAAFKTMLVGCPTNNSVQFADDTTTAGASRTNSGAGKAKMTDVKDAALRKVLARREEAQSVVSRHMGRKEGSFMLSREADASKIFLGRKQEPKCSVGMVRVRLSRRGLDNNAL